MNEVQLPRAFTSNRVARNFVRVRE